MNYTRGEIVWVKFPFSDSATTKLRPSLVISNNNINITGDFSISSGTFDFNQYTSNSVNKGITNLNLNNNFSQTGGTLTETATLTGRGKINFTN